MYGQIVVLFKDDATVGSNELAQAGASASETWFFDYSSGVLNFNGSTLPAGIGTDNVYLVGYRYTGGTGVKPPIGVGTFSSLNVTGIATFHKDVEFIGAGDAGIKSTFWDQSASSLKFLDGVKAEFGDSQDLTLYHDGNSFISGTDGYLQIRNTGGYTYIDATTFRLRNAAGNANQISAVQGAQVELSHAGNIRLVTTGYGVTVTGLEVTGISTFAGLVDINAGGQADTFKVEDLTQYRVVLAGAGGELQDDSKLTFDANSNFNITGGLVVSGITTLGSVGISTGLISGPATMYIDPATVGDNTGLLVVKGNLQVDGTQTTVNSSTMTVTDKNIEIAKGAANDAAADGAGITIDSGDGDKTLNWVDATDAWTSSEHIQVAAGKRLGFADDPNTYIDRPAADTIRFTAGGSERLRINTDGNTKSTTAYDTGDTSPTLYVRNKNTTAATNFASIRIDTSGNGLGVVALNALSNSTSSSADFSIQTRHSGTVAERLRIISTGNVGINSTSPTTTLDVRGTVQVSGISTFSDNITVIDDKKIQIGDSDDLEIWHNSTNNNSYIKESGSGSLIIQAANFVVEDLSGNDYLYAVDGGTTALQFDGSTKLQTLQRGVGIGGSIHIDNDAYVTGITTTVQLKVGANPTVGITTILDEDNMASDSATALATQQSIKAYVDNSAPGGSALAVSADSGSNESINLSSEVLDIEGTANEIETATGTNKVVIGLPDDVTIANDLTVASNAGIGSLSVTGISTFNDVKSEATWLELRANNFRLRRESNTESFIECGGDRVRLYHNDLVRLTTTGYGVTVTGLEVTGISTFAGNVDVNADADISGNLVVGAGGTTITTTVGAAASVGIGTANPAYMLDVAGAINSSTDVKINGTSVLTSALDEAVAMAIALG